MKPLIKIYIEDEDTGTDIYGKYDNPVEYYSFETLQMDIGKMENAIEEYAEKEKEYQASVAHDQDVDRHIAQNRGEYDR